MPASTERPRYGEVWECRVSPETPATTWMLIAPATGQSSIDGACWMVCLDPGFISYRVESGHQVYDWMVPGTPFEGLEWRRLE